MLACLFVRSLYLFNGKMSPERCWWGLGSQKVVDITISSVTLSPPGCPQYLLDKLQKVQNAAARLVCKAKKSDHIHPILETQHWLPVTHRIQYKISTICFNSISGAAPQYLSDLLQPYTPARQLRSARQQDNYEPLSPRV